MQSAERVSQADPSDNYVFQRSILAYYKASDMISGDVLEIGTGSGYGISIIAPHVESFITLDKSEPQGIRVDDCRNVEYHKATVPPLSIIASSSVDYVISFQVIEHIRNDFATIAEAYRVLRPGGKLIISTPNKLKSLTRNPWHIREYTPDEFKNLLGSEFDEVEALGVFGNDKVTEYYLKNKASVERIAKIDVLRLQKWLPRWCLRIPYDVLNRMNRRKLLKSNADLTSSITMHDYYIGPVTDEAYDLYYIATKT